ncbi:MAG: hypothetical protein ACOVN2_07585, partial [Usitatibacteraceae bacterium]
MSTQEYPAANETLPGHLPASAKLLYRVLTNIDTGVLTFTSPEGNTQRYVQQKNAGNPVRFNVPPGAKVDVQIDGVKQTGKELI